MKTLNDYFVLKNGVKIPCIGFGTWQITDEEIVISSVKEAVKIGYRHIDTAAIYENEESIGKAICQMDIAREELFITSKLWNSDRGYDQVMKAFDKTLNKLQTSYLDLYLIHWPANQKVENWEEVNADTWSAFEKLYEQGKIRAIGVSNFLKHHLESLINKSKIVPMVNQIEFHPGQMQSEVLGFCKENQILVEAWGPLGAGKMLHNDILSSIAKKYNKSVAQICIRWCLQNETLPLPKSITAERIEENAKVFDFEIDIADMNVINGLPYIGGSGLDPDRANF